MSEKWGRQSLRGTAIVLAERPRVGPYVPGRCCWCGEPLANPDGAPLRGRTYCYPDREDRDCVGERRRSVVWDPRVALRIVAKREGRAALACVDCGLVVEPFANPMSGEGHVPWEADHEIPLIDGGPHTVENLRARCVPCHAEKTAREATARAERRRPQHPGQQELAA